MFKIGDVEIKNPIIIAPMAGVSNSAFRSMCYNFNAALVYSEMISDKALLFKSSKTFEMCQSLDEEHPLTFQLFGHDIDSMVEAAKYLDKNTKCDIIDINMGCPVNKIVKSNAGSALMKDIDHAVNVVDNIILAKADRLSARGIDITEEIVNANISGLDKLLDFYLTKKDSLAPLPKLIDGREIMEFLNIKPSPKLGEIINAVHEAQLNGDVLTHEDAVRFVLNWSFKE